MGSDHAEENISTEQSPTRQKARISRADGDEERPRGAQAQASEGPQTADGPALLNFRFPKEARLAKRAEFLRVYEHGQRIEGRYMTAFFLPNGLVIPRVGVTATKKAIGKAHDRNRAKRLLRESFRLCSSELNSVPVRYDWVLNARSSILKVKLEKPLADFRSIVRRVAEART